MKLTLDKVYESMDGLKRFSSYEEANPGKVVLNGKVRYNLFRAMRKLRPIVEDANSTKEKIFIECARGKERLEPNTHEFREFQKRMGELSSRVEDVDIEPFEINDLDIEKNNIPISILDSLSALLKD